MEQFLSYFWRRSKFFLSFTGLNIFYTNRLGKVLFLLNNLCETSIFPTHYPAQPIRNNQRTEYSIIDDCWPGNKIWKVSGALISNMLPLWNDSMHVFSYISNVLLLFDKNLDNIKYRPELMSKLFYFQMGAKRFWLSLSQINIAKTIPGTNFL